MRGREEPPARACRMGGGDCRRSATHVALLQGERKRNKQIRRTLTSLFFNRPREVKMLRSLLSVSALAFGLFAMSQAHAVQRTFVSTSGSDANTASNCSTTAPCRGFAAALTVTDTGGEIIVLSSGGYGSVSIDKSVSIVAPEGIYAGISVLSGAGITIATAGVEVVLKGLSINGLGGDYGINMTNGSTLLVENCTVSNFSTAGGLALRVSNQISVQVKKSVFRKNYRAIRIWGGANMFIADTLVTESSYTAIEALADSGSVTTRLQADRLAIHRGSAVALNATSTSGGTVIASIKDSAFHGNSYGIYADASASTTRVSVAQSDFSGNVTGIYAFGSGAVVVLSRNTITRNSYGLEQAASSVIKSASDNVVEENTTADISGSTTAMTLK
ncbi:MAG: right-handed parallel beta-helix repeat-containing protein [Betaproteobacteria bacterium]|nr:right-handed parallel beta-helix repeat-containing protein [Betaproteobacteria bacterium]